MTLSKERLNDKNMTALQADIGSLVPTTWEEAFRNGEGDSLTDTCAVILVRPCSGL